MSVKCCYVAALQRLTSSYALVSIFLPRRDCTAFLSCCACIMATEVTIASGDFWHALCPVGYIAKLRTRTEVGFKGTRSTTNIPMSRTRISGPYSFLIFLFWVDGRDEPSHDPGTGCNAHAHIYKLQSTRSLAYRRHSKELPGQKGRVPTCQVS